MLSNKNVVVITKVIDNIGQFCKNNVAMIFCIAKLKDFLNHLVSGKNFASDQATAQVSDQVKRLIETMEHKE